MASQPTKGNPVELLKYFKGLNDQDDSVKRPSGTVTTDKNILDQQGGDAARRQGRIMSSLDDGNPVGTIFNLTWSDGSNSIINQSGTDFQYGDFYYPNDFTLPDLNADPCADGSTPPIDLITGEPLCPPAFPTGALHLPARKSRRPIPDFVPIIRALAEAYYFAKKGITALTIPTAHTTVDFYTVQVPIVKVGNTNSISGFNDFFNRGFNPRRGPDLTSSPPQDLTQLPFDFYYVDYVNLGPLRYVTDLNALITLYNSTILPSFLKTDPDSDPAALDNYTSGDGYTFFATASNYQQVCAQFSGIINSKLIRAKVATTTPSLTTKTGTAQDSGGCPHPEITNISISAYSDLAFTVSGCPDFNSCICDDFDDGTDGPCDNFDGTFQLNGIITFCTYQSAQMLSEFPPPDIQIRGYAVTPTIVGPSSNNWALNIDVHFYTPPDCVGGTTDALWHGTFNDSGTGDPRGIYTRTLGCSSGPATLTVV